MPDLRTNRCFVPGLLLLALTACQSTDRELPNTPQWRLTFADEFNGPADSQVNSDKWVIVQGGNGWGNRELQTYTDRTENLRLDGEGNLVIEARQETFAGIDRIERPYTSARIHTLGRFSQVYGRFEARLKVPEDQGIWPAFWLLGERYNDVGWPRCGEIDIMENVGSHPTRAHGTLHGPVYYGDDGYQVTRELTDGSKFADGFHVFAVEWEPGEFRWYVDGEQYGSYTRKGDDDPQWVYDTHHFILLNLAVGGHWPGNPDASTRFPKRYLIDYVRVYADTRLDKVVKPLDSDQAAWRKSYAERMGRDQYQGGRRVSLPGLIECENFNDGGPGVAYVDEDPPNQGLAYRPGEHVDIQLCGAEDSRFNVGWTRAGEWLAYDVAVAEAGAYTIEVNVACKGKGGRFHFEINGRPVGGADVPNTGGWQSWRTLRIDHVSLPAGDHTIRLVMDSHGVQSNATGNFNWFRISK